MARILIIEDEPLVALLEEQWVLDLGHEVVGPAQTLATALTLAETSPDAAIIDVRLGRDNSSPVVKVLIARNIPFVFATGHDIADLDPTYCALPPLSKPFAFEEFRGAVQALVLDNQKLPLAHHEAGSNFAEGRRMWSAADDAIDHGQP